jgi:hypothetical protein
MRLGYWKPGVEKQLLQWVADYLNGLLAADLLQNYPGAVQRSIVDWASPAWKHVRGLKAPRNC